MSDLENFDGIIPQVVLDGAALHGTVPPQKWCVTRDDLVRFRHIVEQRVADGKITPTELDSFDVDDNTIGPCIHTINDQMIKPATNKAGKVSWALMLHPEGLECDIFVTHCWQEGIYEFIDKVLHSWPRGSRHAYCCMLSNPQNLDISDLIVSPRESPFAKALQSSTHMMVVPTRTCSIYSRIWCAYEAFLAYSQSKVIFTASAPIPNLTRNFLGVLLLEAILALASCIWSSQFEIQQEGDHEKDKVHGLMSAMSIVVCFCVFFSVSIKPGFMAHLLVCMASVLAGAVFGVDLHLTVVMCTRNGLLGNRTSRLVCDAWIRLALCVATALAEVDVLYCTSQIREAAQLRNGYTGKLLDAQSSVAADKENIHAEVSESGIAEDVDNAIHVLLETGMSTPTIRLAVSRVGRLQQAVLFTRSTAFLAWAIWLYVAFARISDVFEQHWFVVAMDEEGSSFEHYDEYLVDGESEGGSAMDDEGGSFEHYDENLADRESEGGSAMDDEGGSFEHYDEHLADRESEGGSAMDDEGGSFEHYNEHLVDRESEGGSAMDDEGGSFEHSDNEYRVDGDLEGSSYCKQALGYCDHSQEDLYCADVKYCKHPLESPDVWIPLFGVLEALAWLLLFGSLGADKRGFAAKGMMRVLLLAFVTLLLTPLIGGPESWDPMHAIIHLVLAPAFLLLAAAGPGRIACVPVVGPRLVRLILARISFGGCKWGRYNR